MFRILVLYGTTEGQTEKIARAVADTLTDSGASADVVEAGRGQPVVALYEAVVVAASIHAGGYQPAVVRWVSQNHDRLNAMPTAFLTVCLGVLQKDPKVDRDLESVKKSFLDATGWQPSASSFVAGALRYTRYNWLMRRVMKRIAAQAGGDTDTSRDWEYTDWKALAAFTVQFLREVEARRHFEPPRRAAPLVQAS